MEIKEAPHSQSTWRRRHRTSRRPSVDKRRPRARPFIDFFFFFTAPNRKMFLVTTVKITAGKQFRICRSQQNNYYYIERLK